ncbi:hypothetical protein ACHAWC_008242 [Mediolabrus comicus]
MCTILQTAIIASCVNDDERDTLQTLCLGLCQLLAKDNHAALLDEVIVKFSNQQHDGLSKVFLTLAQDDHQCSTTNNNFGPSIIFTALSLVAATTTTKDDDGIKSTLMELFLTSSSLTSSSTKTSSATTTTTFPQPNQIIMAKYALSKCTTQSNFDTLLAPQVGLKLRSHPESVLPLMFAILSSLLQTTTSSSSLDLSTHLTEGGLLLTSTMKHFKSSKVEMRNWAWKTCVLFCRLNNNTVTTKIVVDAICDAFTSLTTSDVRAVGYAALDGIGRYLLHLDDGNDESDCCSDLANRVLSTLVSVLPKDKTVGTATPADPTKAPLLAKEVGYNALTTWIQLFRKYGSHTSGSGYDKALGYLIEPLNKYSPKDGEFRFRFGSLIQLPSSLYFGGDVITGEQKGAKGGEGFLELVIIDLMEKKKIQQGLESIIDAAMKKFASSDSVAQVDGALAVFLLVVYAHHSSGSKLSPSVLKIIAAGGTVKGQESSFLYSPSMLETARTDLLSNYILHRIIALHCKVTAKAEGVTKAGKGADQPLVRVIEKRLNEGHDSPFSAATKVVAVCAANPLCITPMGTMSSTSFSSIQSSLKTIVTYAPVSAKASDAIIYALFSHVNEQSLKHEDARASLNETRSSREQFDPIDETFNKLPACCGNTATRGKLSATASHNGYDPNTVRHVANKLLGDGTVTNTGALCRALVLSHAGTTMKSNRRQRVALVSHMLDMIKDVLLPFMEKSGDKEMSNNLANFVALCASTSSLESVPIKTDGDDKEAPETIDFDVKKSVSPSINEAAMSLITTLGGIAGSFDAEFGDADEDEQKPYSFAYELCIQRLPTHLVSHLDHAIKAMESMTEDDIALLFSPKGLLFLTEQVSASAGKGPSSPNKPTVEKKVAGRKKGGGFDSFADEEWEKQVKKDLAKKKKAQEGVSSGPSDKVLTTEEKETLAQQTKQRDQLAKVLRRDLPRALAAIRCLCESDIEVGNSSLPVVGRSVISVAVSACPALNSLQVLKDDSFDTLSTLASCVYEIEENHAPTLARALTISFSSKKGEGALTVSALPSPCASAACSIFEMDEYGDCLSGNSFVFLFPIIQAALIGPRNVPGCDAALAVLERHCAMLAGDEVDAAVKQLRKDMAGTVLELLSHDRSQTFVNPSAYEALTSCYTTDDASPGLSAPEIAPLLGDRGALGGENNRVAAMTTLAAIARDRPKLVKSNPLIENRIWLNCFAKADRIKVAARKAWLVANGQDTDADVSNTPLSPPSKMYAVPLLPLLSNEDITIASAAATSFAHAVGMHPDTAEKNIVKLCNTYIGSFPAPGSDGEEKATKSSSPFPAVPTPVVKPTKKKVIDTGLPKKKTKKISSVSTSMSKITGAPAPKKSANTKKLLAKVAAPKKERTLDQDSLMDQFKSPSSVKQIKAEDDSESKVAVRMGVLRAISSLTDPSAKVQLNLPVLKILLSFLMSFGLGDGNESLRNASRDAARDIVASYGSSEEATLFFLPQLEAVLSSGRADEKNLDPLSPEKVPKSLDASDFRKEGVVVSLGSIALHLKDDTKIDGIIDMLLKALNTPSEDVQSSVALCLSKLMKKGTTQERVESLLDDLMKECIHGTKLASRRGAAYGISAVVKGSGIASLKKYEVVKRLEEACTSGSPTSKEGALFAIELLSSRLGILFEPYVIVLLPALLKAFSDSNDHVRTAADKTVGLIMANLSGHGVKLVMPAVLEAFNEPEWRTKQASIHMLGSMSHCAPKQLASCLPKVVPKLTEAFSDTHPKVKKSAQEALEEICTVIKNPEISSISEIILHALTDPASGTLHALEALISTEFLHAIDAPSLSIIIPVVHRGLRDRAATTKRYAALISGNICTMVNDARDFVPYLPILLPDLKSALLDPIPDVRSISAKALGSLTRGVGEATFPDLRPWLVETLRSESGSSVERSGAAQGLTEILVAGGARMVENVMINEILPLNSHPKAGTREGVLWVLTFLPSALGQAYAPLIDESLPALLSGLADDNETVRDVALRAGRVLVKSNGKAHKDKILPSLENGLSNEDYRIRVASLTLLGDLLSMLGGTKVVKGNADTQDDIRQAERAQAQIALVLGNETRKRVLSSLYLARSDTAAVVRQAAVQVWKTVVSVTPRTLREILSELVDQIVVSLASGDPERTQVAGRCLGDIVQKLGDQVLPEVIPVLRDSLYRGDDHTRQGVCVGLAEVIACSSKEQIIKFLDILVKVVQDALCDEDDQVRKMATQCFQSLFQVVGTRTLDEVVPALLVAMESEDEDSKTRALNGVTGILSVRSRELLPYIIPRVLKTPLTISHADALGSISEATSQTIHMHFNSIVPTLIMELASFHDVDPDEEGKSREEAVRRCSRAICHNVDTVGVNWLISEVVSKCTNDKESVRKEACWFLQIIVEERKAAGDFHDDVDIIIRELMHRLNDDSSVVLKANNAAIGALTKCVPVEELAKHIRYIKDLIGSMVSDARYRKGGVGDGEFFLPGLNIPKGLEPLLPIYQRGILYGDATTRELAASGLGDLIKITQTKYLAGPFLIKLTGPLLRIVGDRNPPAVKIAIVQTLGLILTKGGPALRAFVPQFQTTFVKALSDPSRQVRVEAIKALALLMPLSTRVDPLIKELVSTSLGKSSNVTADTAGLVAIQTATLEALAVVLKHGGSKVKLAESVPSSLDAGKELIRHEDDGIRESAAKVIGYACQLLDADAANSVLEELVIDESSNLSACSVESKHGMACICRRILSRPVGAKVDRDLYKSVTTVVLALMKDSNSLVKEAASVAIGAVLGSSNDIKSTIPTLEKSIAKNMDTKEELSVQQGAANGLCIAARLQPGIFRTQDGLFLINTALKMAMSGSQRVQFSYNDFLWVALDVKNGEAGLDEYLEHAYLEEAKKMKAIYSKVLVKIKDVNDDD